MPKKAIKKRGNTKKTARKSAKKAVKPAKKKTVRKAAKKTSAKKASKSKKISNAPEGKEFFLINGKKVKNYHQLAKIMEDLEDHVFHHHVNPSRNDFAIWVRDVFEDINLAKKIAGISKKEHLELVLYRRIVRGK